MNLKEGKRVKGWIQMKILINRYMWEAEKKAKHTLGKEEQFDFKLPREQTKTEIVKTK